MAGTWVAVVGKIAAALVEEAAAAKTTRNGTIAAGVTVVAAGKTATAAAWPEATVGLAIGVKVQTGAIASATGTVMGETKTNAVTETAAGAVPVAIAATAETVAVEVTTGKGAIELVIGGMVMGAMKLLLQLDMKEVAGAKAVHVLMAKLDASVAHGAAWEAVSAAAWAVAWIRAWVKAGVEAGLVRGALAAATRDGVGAPAAEAAGTVGAAAMERAGKLEASWGEARTREVEARVAVGALLGLHMAVEVRGVPILGVVVGQVAACTVVIVET